MLKIVIQVTCFWCINFLFSFWLLEAGILSKFCVQLTGVMQAFLLGSVVWMGLVKEVRFRAKARRLLKLGEYRATKR